MLLRIHPHALYQTADQGKSWQKIAIGPFGEGKLSSVAPSPAGSGIIYVAGRGLGVLRTGDGGKNWVQRSDGLPSRDVIAVAAHTTQPDTVYAVVNGQGIYRSQDAGKTWRLMDRSSQQGLRQLIHSDMAGSMQTGWLFAATATGVRRSMDCFCLWQDAGKLGNQADGVTYDSNKPEHLYAATEKGLFRSADGGENWVEMKSPNPKVVGLAFTRSGALFAISADGDLYRSEDQGTNWMKVNA
jgi:photosystem II stability/assembly factor-like uncharacterized protein